MNYETLNSLITESMSNQGRDIIAFVEHDNSEHYVEIVQDETVIVFKFLTDIKVDDVYLHLGNKILPLTTYDGVPAFKVEYIDFKIIGTFSFIVISGKKYIANWDRFFNKSIATLQKYLKTGNSEANKFFHETFFSPNARKFVVNRGFYLSVAVFNEAPKDAPVFLGVLTLLSFRYMEKPLQQKEFVLKVIIERGKLKFGNDASPSYIRWFISSATATAVVALSLDKIEYAKKILDSALGLSSYTESMPITAMNFYTIQLLYAILIREKKENIEEFKELTNSIFIGVKKSISNIYSMENYAVISQVADCRALINIGAQTLMLRKAYSPNNTSYAVDHVSRFLTKSFLPRFDNKNIIHCGYFKQLDEKINAVYLSSI